jgi:hypothetical protein
MAASAQIAEIIFSASPVVNDDRDEELGQACDWQLSSSAGGVKRRPPV